MPCLKIPNPLFGTWSENDSFNESFFLALTPASTASIHNEGSDGKYCQAKRWAHTAHPWFIGIFMVGGGRGDSSKIAFLQIPYMHR